MGTRPWYEPDEELEDERGQGLLDVGVPIEPPERKPKSGGVSPASFYTEDWTTGPEILDLVRQLYGGTIDLDPLSSEQANIVVAAKRIYTLEDDGLAHHWDGRVLLNPPWGDSYAQSTKLRAITKALAEYGAGRMTECCLVLNANAMTTAWFKPLLAFPVCVPSRRIKHLQPGGLLDDEPTDPNSGTVIVYMGKRVREFNRVFGVLGTVLVAYQDPRK